MVSVVDVIGLLLILAVNATVAALMTRFFRVRLDTRWGPIIFVVLLVPLVLLVLTLVLGGAGLGPDLGTPGIVVGTTVLLPTAIGVSFDYFWMPNPDEVELPAEYQS